ncbi:hypothetical protein KHS38_14005 [Mucilaginibacter sp. Bleaf8]|uniref:hypothetical protein n=1 Tax=Mucilaginibacter sp. Bleaf8 TaxID=2834430 RepID=UPI001BCB9039|nr:hypothetical protein [Mucilaginibacter sp. Bleaf8]MBS7565522.1 hypothetical protein [Mucilaginibacter sp. Bleaf8]
MKTDELQQQIRFSIAQLSSRNGAADFEKICFYIARKRLHDNVLPATGPVQAGGDQGRDFETFHTYLSHLPDAASKFIAGASKVPVAFACSLEKDPTAKSGKIFQDVKTIKASGTVVERVYFFSGEDIPVGHRHKCIEHIKNTLNVEVEIMDAQALSLLLTDGDLFWIAVQYLKIASEAYPAIATGWYQRLLEEHRERETPRTTYEEFTEIKAALRHIYKDMDLKKDLLFWLPKLDSFIASMSIARNLVRKAIYEKFVASLMGLDEITGQEANVINFFSDLETCDSPQEIEDTQILLSFCITAKLKSRHTLEMDYLHKVCKRFEKTLYGKLNASHNPDTKAALMQTNASFALNDPRKNLPFESRIEKYIQRMNGVVALLPKTHFFSVQELSERIEDFMDLLLTVGVDTTELEKVTAKLNPYLEKWGGRDLVARKLQKQAVAYLKHRLYFKAIGCLHEIKIKWFNSESLEQSIDSCLLLAKSYKEINLLYASKYYGFIAAYLAFKDEKVEYFEKFLAGISAACDCDYLTGTWFNYLELLEFLTITHFQMTKDFDVYQHEDRYRILYYPALINYYAKSFIPKIESIISDHLKNWGFLSEEIAGNTEEIKQKMQPEVLKEKMSEQLFGQAFNDIGQIRVITFNAYGCNWSFEFLNDHVTTSLAEEFIAMLQILLADLIEDETYLIPGDVRVKIIKTDDQTNFIKQPSNESSEWLLELAEYVEQSPKSLNDHEYSYLIAAQSIISEISLLNDAAFEKLLNKKLKEENLIGKVTFGRPYAELFRYFIQKESFDSWHQRAFDHEAVDQPISVRLNDQLPWKDSLAPGYNELAAMTAISNRIEAVKKMLSVTLPLLKTSESFMLKIQSLRSKGWLDWQILHAIGTMAINFKAQPLYSQAKSREQLIQMQQDFRRDEKEWYVEISEDILQEERLSMELSTILPATLLPSFGLQSRSKTPNGEAIVKLLSYRFRYLEDGKEIIIF